ncbi:MAG: lipopolysaccharide assembly LapA domain-containing protein [Clostridia bacterium]
MHFFLIFALIIAIVTVFFAIQNTTMVTVYFFVWQFTSSLAIILLFSLGLGVILTLLISFPKIQARNWQISKLKKQTTELTEENAKLKEEKAKQEGQVSALLEQLNDYKKYSYPSNERPDNENTSDNKEDDKNLFKWRKE